MYPWFQLLLLFWSGNRNSDFLSDFKKNSGISADPSSPSIYHMPIRDLSNVSSIDTGSGIGSGYGTADTTAPIFLRQYDQQAENPKFGSSAHQRHNNDGDGVGFSSYVASFF